MKTLHFFRNSSKKMGAIDRTRGKRLKPLFRTANKWTMKSSKSGEKLRDGTLSKRREKLTHRFGGWRESEQIRASVLSPKFLVFRGQDTRKLVLSVLLNEFVDQVHGLQRVRCEPLETSLCVFQRGQIPFRLLSAVDVA